MLGFILWSVKRGSDLAQLGKIGMIGKDSVSHILDAHNRVAWLSQSHISILYAGRNVPRKGHFSYN
jgi:hypothetical protein